MRTSILALSLRFVFCVCLLATGSAIASSNNSAHPLDPLTKEEMAEAVAILKAGGKASQTSRFPLIALNEPPKEEVLAFKPGDAMRREAFAVVYERASNKTFEAIVDLKGKGILSWKEIPGVQPTLLIEDYLMMQGIVRSNPEWQEAIKKRGITDFRKVQIDPWSAGHFGFPEEKGVRVFRGVSYYKGESKNYYARPIEGVVAYVDLNAKRVIKVVDSGVVPVAKATADYHPDAVGKLREAPKPLQITQPQGASFRVAGNEVRWQKWRFRFGVHPREGLVLYTVGYEEKERLRSVLYRASLSEMVVPYGDPGPSWFFRNAFDEGEFAIGRFANSLDPLNDAPENATFFSAVVPSDIGGPIEVPRAVALYERDGGLLWKHSDFESGNESRRARQLVLSWIATVGNYEYGFNWIFNQDGMLEMEVLLTGIMQTKGVEGSNASDHNHNKQQYGHLIADGVEAVHHQHFFNFRLDLDVDSASGNSVVEMNTEAVPAGPKNPYMNAFVMKNTVFGREKDAQRQVNMATGRKWSVINSAVKNSLGQPVGYMLLPGENAVPFADPRSSVRKRAGFMSSHLWVTPYDRAETNAAGYYINQNPGGEGLPKWTSANRSIENRDVVLWYTMGLTHIPRPEEWPVMTCHRAGFKLLPSGFFARNPALDVPRTQ